MDVLDYAQAILKKAQEPTPEWMTRTRQLDLIVSGLRDDIEVLADLAQLLDDLSNLYRAEEHKEATP